MALTPEEIALELVKMEYQQQKPETKKDAITLYDEYIGKLYEISDKINQPWACAVRIPNFVKKSSIYNVLAGEV